jgi:hypothetical protein
MGNARNVVNPGAPAIFFSTLNARTLYTGRERSSHGVVQSSAKGIGDARRDFLIHVIMFTTDSQRAAAVLTFYFLRRLNYIYDFFYHSTVHNG